MDQKLFLAGKQVHFGEDCPAVGSFDSLNLVFTGISLFWSFLWLKACPENN